MTRSLRLLVAALAIIGGSSLRNVSRAAEKLDLSSWERLPVLENGRLMPIDTFARTTAEAICDRQKPELGLRGISKDDLASDELAGARELFPEGKPRRWTASELLLSWLIEPDKWEHVPFLIAEHESLRKLLEVPINDAEGNHLKYVSPAQVNDSQKFQEHLVSLLEKQRQARMKREAFNPVGLDAKVQELYQAYQKFRQLTFNPIEHSKERSRFRMDAEQAAEYLQKLGPLLADPGLQNENVKRVAGQINSSFEKLAQRVGEFRFKISEVEPAVVELKTATAELAQVTSEANARAAGLSRQLADAAGRMHVALYDNGDALRIVPSLEASALREDRQEDASSPWLALQTVLYGSPELLSGYPSSRVDAVRKTFRDLSEVYRNHTAQDPSVGVTTALNAFTGAVRALGEEINIARRDLEIAKPDEKLIQHTAYPPPTATADEVTYNHVDPFMWSWIISLTAVFALSLAFGVVRRPMFWIAMCVLGLALASMIYGFYLRVRITGWAPVTGMYETVIYVPMFVAALGAWFTLLPVLWPGIKNAWRLSALPGSWEATPIEHDQQRLFASETWALLNWLMLLPRVALMGMFAWLLAFAPYAAGDRTIINLLPVVDVGSSLPDANNLLVWIVGMCVFLPAVWYLPRVVLTVLASPLLVPLSLRGRTRELVPQVYPRWPFAFAATGVAFAGSFLAWYLPAIPGREFSPLQPVLRDNFWLTIHVLTIVSSYGAGALAWGLGIIALCYYLFGRYRDVQPSRSGFAHRTAPAAEAAINRRPPAQCATLAGYIYKAMQVAVLLLAAGTILGGLWADVSWGRFWGWDPKEVWALVSLLTYLIILHGRYAGWFGNFGLAVGSIMGATSIAMSWYGVNFLLGAGLHSYGFGSGGQLEVGIFILLNWLLLGAAAARYWSQTGAAGAGESVAPRELEESAAAV